MKHCAPNQRGIALIMAVLLSAMVAALSITLTGRVHLWLKQVQNRQDMHSAQRTALAAIDLARLTLRDDARKNHVDHMLEAWTMPIPPMDVEEGQLGGRVVELQGLFNLANLIKNGQPDRSALQHFQRLLIVLGLESSLSDRLEQALIAHLQARNPATLAVFPYQSLEALGELPGFTSEAIEKLKPFVTLLPEPGPVNANFMSPELLLAMLPEASRADVNTLISQRSGHFYATVNDFIAAFPEALRGKVARELFVVESRYFLIEVDSWFGRAHLRYQALLGRKPNNLPEMIWLRRIYEGGISPV